MKLNLLPAVIGLVTIVPILDTVHAQNALAPVITSQPVSQAAIKGENVVLTVGVSGAPPFGYRWLFNGTNLPNGIITTVAGNGTRGYSGDGGAATNATLDYPSSVAVDAAGDIFFTEIYDARVRMVNTRGVITTVVGNGTWGYSGDGGAATNANIDVTHGVAADASGNLFVAGADNRIRKVDASGIITTFAGNGVYSFSGDGGPATNAGLAYPQGLVVDAFNRVLIADYDNQRIRMVSTNGIITTIAGNGTNGYSGDDWLATNATLAGPSGVTVDTNGNVFIEDAGNARIRLVGTNNIMTTWAGNGNRGNSGDGGWAINATLNLNINWPGVAVDSRGDLFIASDTVREVNASHIITTVAGGRDDGGGNFVLGDGGAATNASVQPTGIAVDVYGNLYIADALNRIRKVTILGPTLPLPQVTAANAGTYQLIVTNGYGSVTSSVVSLTVALPQISAVAQKNGSVTFNLLTAPATVSELLAATSLIPPVVWEAVATNPPGNSGAWQFIDTNASQYPARFYRIYTP